MCAGKLLRNSYDQVPCILSDVVTSELPSNLVLKKASPRIWLPTLTIAWGIITMCLGFVRNYGGFVAVRAMLGIAEGGLLPGMVCNDNPLSLTRS